MRVFATRSFNRFARRNRVLDDALCEAVARAERGLIDADLGGGVIKQRAARPGQGRSGGYRVLIAYQPETRAVFLFGFAKNDQENIDDAELTELRKATREILSWNVDGISSMLESGAWTEVECNGEDVQK